MNTSKSVFPAEKEEVKKEVKPPFAKEEPKVVVKPKEEEPKKLTVVEILVAALKGHGHIYSPEEKKALGDADPEIKAKKEAEEEKKRLG